MTGSAHRLFLAKATESVGDLLDRADASIVVIRKTPAGDLLVAALPAEIETSLSFRELAEHFG